MDSTTTKKMLLQAISEVQSKKKGQYLDNIRHFCEENYEWDNSKTDELLTSCVNESILRKVVSNGKDSYRVMTHNIKNTQLDDIEVLLGDQHIVPVDDDESRSISPLAPIDILYEEFPNFKTFVCQELNFIKQELSDVKKNTIKVTGETVITKLAVETCLMRKSYCLKAIAPFCYKNYTTNK